MSVPDIRLRNHRRSNLVRGIALSASVALFLGSLATECFYVDRNGIADSYGIGMMLLLIGWLGVLTAIPAWLANPALLMAWATLFVRQRLVAVVVAGLALGFSLSFLAQRDILVNEGGGKSAIVGYGPGYWLWIASIGVLLVGASLGMILDSNARRESPDRSL
jgi:hypothetical protein